MAETINSLYKTESIQHRGPWRTLETVEFATLEWVDWFNHRCLLKPIGNIPPAEAEARYYAQAEGVAWRRDSTNPASGNPGRFRLTNWQGRRPTVVSFLQMATGS